MKKEENDEYEPKRKRSVTFGKSTTYEVLRESAENDSGDFNNLDIGGEGKVSPRPMKKILEEKDLSDGRNEKEKIKAELERKEQEELEAIKKMRESSKAAAQEETKSKF